MAVKNNIIEVRPLLVPGSLDQPRIVRFLNGRTHLLATIQGLTRGQTILVRGRSKIYRENIKQIARKVRVRIKIEEYIEMHTVRVTCLGPMRKRTPKPLGQPSAPPSPRVRCFHPVKPKPRSTPLPASTPTPQIDIFS